MKMELGFDIYDAIEKATYGPDSTLDSASKVFLCIRHKIYTDIEIFISLTKEFIANNTGLTKKQVEKALYKLEKDQMILVHRSYSLSETGGKIWNTNSYEVHPKRCTTETIGANENRTHH